MERFDIGQALDCLRSGLRVRRRGWNGVGMYLVLIDSGQWDFQIEHTFSTPKMPWVGIKAANGSFGPWTISQSDLLAEDWEIAE